MISEKTLRLNIKLDKTPTKLERVKIKEHFHIKYGVPKNRIKFLIKKNGAYVEDQVTQDNISSALRESIGFNFFDSNVDHDLIYEEFFLKIKPDNITLDEFKAFERDEIAPFFSFQKPIPCSYEILRLQSKNLTSFKDFNLNFKDLNGIIRITSNPVNGAGKSNIVNIISLMLFGKYYSHTPSTLDQVINKFAKTKKASVLGLLYLNDVNKHLVIERFFEKKKNVSQTINAYIEVNEDNASHLFDLESNEIKTLNEITSNKVLYVKKTKLEDHFHDTIKNFYFVSVFTQNNISKWLSLTPKDRTDYFYEILGLNYYTLKYEVAKDRHKKFLKENNIDSIKLNAIDEEQKELHVLNKEYEKKIEILEEKIESNKLLLKNTEKEIEQLLSGKYKIENSVTEEAYNDMKKNREVLENSLLHIKISSSDDIQLLKEKRDQCFKKLSALEKNEKYSKINTLTNDLINFKKDPVLVKAINNLEKELSNYKNEYNIYKAKIDEKTLEIKNNPANFKCQYCTKFISFDEKRKQLNDEITVIKETNNNVLTKAKEIRKKLDEKKEALRVKEETFKNSIMSEIENLKYELQKEKERFLQSIKDIDEQISNIERYNKVQEKIRVLDEKIGYYLNNKDLISKNKEIDLKILALNDEKEIYSSSYEDLLDKKSNLVINFKNNDYKISELKKTKDNFLKAFEQDRKFTAYLDIHYKKIKSFILKTIIDTINAELNEILDNLYFKVNVNIDKRNNIYFTYIKDNQEFDISHTSGFEGFISTLALHLFFVDMSYQKSNLLFLDEIFGNVGYSNIPLSFNLIEEFKSRFLVLPITHRQEIAEYVDGEINVVMNDNISLLKLK